MEKKPLTNQYTNEWFKTESLSLLAGQLALMSYQGYPSNEKRLWLDSCDDLWEPVLLPDGPWETSNGELPTIREQTELRSKGFRLDAYGRPLHPWFETMLHHPGIGLVTGKGSYWNWGPNFTADPIVIRYDQITPHVLLIQRRDTNTWALPGGFVDKDETPLDTAIREAGEETFRASDESLTIDIKQLDPKITKIYSGPLADLRVTANAWPNTTAYKFDLPIKVSRSLPLGPYEVKDVDNGSKCAMWHPIDQPLPLYGSHSLLVEMAIANCLSSGVQ